MAKDNSYDAQLKRFLIPILRRKSLYWPARQEAKRDARVERGLYCCEKCKKLFGTSEIEMDHKVPVINIKTSFTNWDNYIRSLYCDKSNFSALCKGCHEVKSQIEQAQRVINKKKVKKNKKVVDK